jgi:hypothetical protein
MQTMNVDIPDSLKEYAQQQVAECGYSSISDYLCKLLQADQLQKERQTIEAEVLRGLQCHETVPFNAQTRNEMRAELLRRLEQKRG